MKHYGILFNRKSGKVVKVLEDNFGSALLKMYGLNNTSATRDFVVFGEDGIVKAYMEGKKNDMPTICKDMEGMEVEKLGFSVSDLEQ